MSTKKKLLQAAAGSAGGAAALNVEQVFSTYLYEGNGSEQFIDNGINLGQANDGYSAYFGGAGYYVGAEQTTLTDFTVEGWFYFSNLASNRTLFTLGYADLQLYYRSASSNLAIYDTSAKTYSWTPTGSTWYHIALVRSGSSVELFVDGVSKGTQTSSATISGDLIIGGYAGATDPMNGYISNIRVSDNVRYSSNFTAPTSALTTDANTTLLTLQDDTFIDNSGNGNVITPSGGAEMVSHAPFTAADAGEGGLVWLQQRDGSPTANVAYDTERGATKRLIYNQTNSESTEPNELTSFNSNGFSLGSAFPNTNGANHASWTFRKAPKFFDIVTYTGNGTGQTIPHNLNCDVGTIIVKNLTTARNWVVRHRSGGLNDYFNLNNTNAVQTNSVVFGGVAPTSTDFTVGSAVETNTSGENYVAYLFAHNDGDGTFGPTGDQDIIKCGSYTGNGSATGPVIDLGFEPQWLLIKKATASGTNRSWWLADSMRGFVSGSGDEFLQPNSSAAESGPWDFVKPTATGFQLSTTDDNFNTNNINYIYIAIRRGPMAVPTAATDVFAIDTWGGGEPAFTSNFPVDMSIFKGTGGSNSINTARLIQGKGLYADTTGPEVGVSYAEFDYMDGWNSDTTTNSAFYAWMWKRAPNFFDVVAYTGNQTAGHNISHNLGVAPEMMWVKKRDGAADWRVYHSGIGATKYLTLNTTAAAATHTTLWNDTAPTDSVFTLGTESSVNTSGSTYIAYLFASVDGVSKVGSFTGNGTTINVDCGFSSGARFVMTKRTDAGSDWVVWDTERGIVAGNDPFLVLNDVNAESSSYDNIDPYSSGFSLNYDGVATNVSGASYIFYAIA